MGSPSRHGRHDGEFVRGPDGCIEPADETDVLVVQVDGHEGIRGAVFVAKARGEGGEAPHDVIDRFADSRATRLEGVCTVRLWRQHGWKIDCRHGWRMADGRC